ncbi:MAG: hypothetical protein VB119_06740 [Candidatus Metalachnospira sp.]|nr:hypothetical protein [Candidatus Metalachnospira sp.]
MPVSVFAETNIEKATKVESIQSKEEIASTEEMEYTQSELDEMEELDEIFDEYVEYSKEEKKKGIKGIQIDLPDYVAEQGKNEITALSTAILYEQEPNDRIKDANKLVDNSKIYGNIEDKDVL